MWAARKAVLKQIEEYAQKLKKGPKVVVDRDHVVNDETERSESRGTSRSESIGERRSESRGKWRSESRGKARSESRGKVQSESRGKARSESRGKSRSESRGKDRSESRGKARSESRGKARSESRGKNRVEPIDIRCISESRANRRPHSARPKKRPEPVILKALSECSLTCSESSAYSPGSKDGSLTESSLKRMKTSEKQIIGALQETIKAIGQNREQFQLLQDISRAEYELAQARLSGGNKCGAVLSVKKLKRQSFELEKYRKAMKCLENERSRLQTDLERLQLGILAPGFAQDTDPYTLCNPTFEPEVHKEVLAKVQTILSESWQGQTIQAMSEDDFIDEIEFLVL